MTARLWFAVLSLLAFPANGEDLRHAMDCDVMSNSVTWLEEGRVETFSGVEESFDIGDSLRLTIQLEEASENLEIRLIDQNRHGEQFFGSVMGIIDGEYWQTSKMDSETGAKVISVSQLNGDRMTIAMDSVFINGRDLAKFERYYKNDWQGMIVKNVVRKFLVQVVTVDCRTVQDEFEEIFDHILANND